MTPDQLLQQAQAGDPNAQTQLGAALNQAGRGSEALGWFEKAAKSGHPDATLAFATALALGQFVDADPVRAIRMMKKSARTHPHCRRALASAKLSGFGTTPDWSGAMSLLIENAKAGDAGAQRQLGTLVLLAGKTDLGVRLLVEAAEQNEIIAQGLLLRHLNDNTLSHPGAGLWRETCLKVRYPLGQDLQAMALDGAPLDLLPGPFDWQAVTVALTKPPKISAEDKQNLHKSPDITVLKSLLPGPVIDTILAFAAPQMRPAEIVDPATGTSRQDPYRRAGAMTFLPLNQDPVISALDRILTGLAGLPLEQGEQIGVLSYQAGDEYRPHYDCFIGDDGLIKDELKRGGQRIRTVLLALTDDFMGGGTAFPRLDITINAPRGSVVIFDNVDAKGMPEDRSLHAGLPVTAGMKWMATKWIRAKAYDRLG